MDNREEMLSVLKSDKEKKIKVLRSLYIRKGVSRQDQTQYYYSKGAEHANELTEEDINERIKQLYALEDSEAGLIFNWKRKVMAVCWAYLTEAGYENATSDYVKECICTSQRAVNLNSMTKSQLIKAFYLFNKKKEEIIKQKNKEA